MPMRRGEERFYVGTNSPGILGVKEVKDPFITNTGKRWVWVVIIILLLIGSLTAGIHFSNLLRKTYMEQTRYETPADAATAEVGKTLLSLYAKSTEITDFHEDAAETARAYADYIGSEKAAELGWSGEDLKGHFTVFFAEYLARYDQTKSVMKDGRSCMYIYLIQDAQSGEWEAVGTAPAPEEQNP